MKKDKTRRKTRHAFPSARELRPGIETWRRTRRLARQQTALAKCPCCFAEGAEFLFDDTKYSLNIFISRGLAKGRYSLCHTCGAVFAAIRSRPEAAAAFYELFKDGQPEIDNYPPVAVARGVDKRIVNLLQDRDLLRHGMTVLQIRCDTGNLLTSLRNLIPSATLHGLDYFDSYVRFVREQGFDAERLNPGQFEIPFGAKYDLILSNHQLTHAIDPRGFLDQLRGALKAGGHILFYNEIDHDIELDTGSKDYRRSEMIAFHKQLFVKDSMEWLLGKVGLEYEYLSQTKAKMMYLARRSTLNASPAPVAPAVLGRQRRRIAAWQEDLRPQRERPLRERVNKSLHQSARLVSCDPLAVRHRMRVIP